MVKKSLLYDTLLQFFVSTFISIKNEAFHEYGAKHNLKGYCSQLNMDETSPNYTMKLG